MGNSDTDVAFQEHNDKVARLVRRQNEMVNTLVADGERALAAGDQATASLLLFKAQLGGPKNRRLMKQLQEPGVKQLVQKMELEHLADRKLPASKQQYRDLEDDLLFVLDEKGHTVHLTEKGTDFLSPNAHEEFVLPDIAVEVGRVDHDPALSAQAFQVDVLRRPANTSLAGRSAPRPSSPPSRGSAGDAFAGPPPNDEEPGADAGLLVSWRAV